MIDTGEDIGGDAERPFEDSVLCATDLSEASRHALGTAIDLSASLGSATRLHVLHVHETVERIDTVQNVVERWEERKQELERQIHAEVRSVTARRATPPTVTVLTAIRSGKAYREILKYALKAEVTWIVIGTHGRTGLGHMLGSVAERIVRHAPCTVVVAKSPDVRARLAHTLEEHVL